MEEMGRRSSYGAAGLVVSRATFPEGSGRLLRARRAVLTTGRQYKRRLAALPLAAKRSAGDLPWSSNDRQHNNHASQRSCDEEPACLGCEALSQQRAQVGGAPKLGVTQNLVEILELNAIVVLHGFTPEMFR
ncbi:hypothetical protein [Bradyrhizobium viridifuturi]|uniref:hypothetical protein n=1 Tax=Bradyrhizobium viridifuturi TaxID=1654716 RepID=UPI000FE14001|nr:hypothetical protein [Bradyrhizobium viridifuturi]